MGGKCCGPSPIELERMNKDGVYTDKQINTVVGQHWDENNPEKNKMVSKAIGSIIVKSSVLALLKFGGSAKFSTKLYNQHFETHKEDQNNLSKVGAQKIVKDILHLNTPVKK